VFIMFAEQRERRHSTVAFRGAKPASGTRKGLPPNSRITDYREWS